MKMITSKDDKGVKIDLEMFNELKQYKLESGVPLKIALKQAWEHYKKEVINK